MADKTIRISFAVDEQSARKAQQLISDLTRSVEKLVQATSRVGGAMGAVGGTGGGGVTVSGKRAVPGLGGAAHLATPGARGGGIVTNVLGVTDVNALRGLVSGTERAFSTVSSNIKTFVDRAMGDITRLQRAVDGLNRSMGGMNAGTQTGALGGGGGSSGTQTGTAGAPAVPGLLTGGGGPGGGKRGGGLFGGTGGGFNPLSDFFQKANLPIPAALSRLAPSILGPVGGTVAAAVSGYEYLAGASQENRIANLKYSLNEPIERQTRRAAVAAPHIQLYQQTKAGNAAYGMAFREALNDPEAMNSIRFSVDQRAELIRRVKGLQDPRIRSLGGRVRSAAGMNDLAEQLSGVQNLGDVFKLLTGQSTSGAINNLDDTTRMSVRKIAEETGLRGMATEQTEQFQQLVDAKYKLMDPRLVDVAQSVVAESQGNVSLRRQGFYGVGRDQDPLVAMKARAAKLARSSWSIEEEAAARRSIVHTAGMGYLGMAMPILSAETGGLQGAGGLLRMGGILGGSKAAAGRFFSNVVQKSVGRGGLDITAGSELFNSELQKIMASGQFGAGNTAATYMQNMAGLIQGGGMDTAQQQRRMGMIQGGLADFASYTQGTKAPLYKATSLMGAMGAAGGYGAASEALTRMDPRLLMSIAQGGAVPEWAKGEIDQQTAQKFLAYQRKAPLFEVQDQMFKGEKRQLLDEARAGGGDPLDIIKRRTSGLTGKAKAKEQQRLSEQFGGILFESGLSESPEAAAGVFLSQLEGGKLKGRGAHALGPRGLEKEGAEHKADQLALDAVALNDNIGKLTMAIRTLTSQGEGGRTVVEKLGKIKGAMTLEQETAIFSQNMHLAAEAAHEFYAVVSRNKQRPEKAKSGN